MRRLFKQPNAKASIVYLRHSNPLIRDTGFVPRGPTAASMHRGRCGRAADGDRTVTGRIPSTTPSPRLRPSTMGTWSVRASASARAPAYASAEDTRIERRHGTFRPSARGGGDGDMAPTGQGRPKIGRVQTSCHVALVVPTPPLACPGATTTERLLRPDVAVEIWRASGRRYDIRTYRGWRAGWLDWRQRWAENATWSPCSCPPGRGDGDPLTSSQGQLPVRG